MENEDRLFRWLIQAWGEGYQPFVRFWCNFYGGEAAARAADQTSRDDPRKAREKAS